MSRRKGSLNRQPSFVGTERMMKKAAKTVRELDSFIDLALRNHTAKLNLDFNKLHETKDAIKYLTEKESYS